MTRRVLESVISWLTRHRFGSGSENLLVTDIQINTTLIARHPGLFPEERHVFNANAFIGGAVDFVDGDETFQGFRATMGDDAASIYKPGMDALFGISLTEDEANLIVDEIAALIILRQARMKWVGYSMFSFIPAYTVPFIVCDDQRYPESYGRMFPGVGWKTKMVGAPSRFQLTAENHA